MKTTKLQIIGAGFSGLSLAYFLVKQGFSVEVFEREECPGGLIQTHALTHGLAESAANGLLATKLVGELFSDLGLPMQRTLRKSRARFIFRQGFRKQPYTRWPLGVAASLKFLGFLLRPRKPLARPGESIASWCERNLNQESARFLIEPALQGIYAGKANELSASLILNPLLQRQNARSRGTVSTPGGMGKLIAGLVAYLTENGVIFHYGKSPTNFSQPTIFATSAPATAALLRDHSPTLAEQFARVPMLSLATCTVFWREPVKPIPGFGILFPEGQGVRALGVLANSNIFSGRGDLYSETWIYGGARDRLAPALSNDEILNWVNQDRSQVMRESASAAEYFCKVWPAAIPYYSVELEALLSQLKPEYPEKQFYFTGNYWGRLGLAKILEQNLLLAERLGTLYG